MKKIVLILFIVFPYIFIHAQGINTLVTKAELDSALATFYTYTDTKQLVVKSDTLVFSDTLSGKAAFVSTDTSTTVIVIGLDSLDVIIVTPEGNASNNVLSVYPTTNSFDVRRLASGAISGLKFNWLWIRKLQ